MCVETKKSEEETGDQKSEHQEGIVERAECAITKMEESLDPGAGGTMTRT